MNQLSIILSIAAGIILGVLSNWLYDLLRARNVFPEKPTLKRVIMVVFGFIPFLLIVALPAFLDKIETQTHPSNSASVPYFVFQIRVYDDGTENIITDAKVILEVAGTNPIITSTDDNGYAGFFLQTHYDTLQARIIVERVPGYQRYIQEIDLNTNQLPFVVKLEAIASGTSITSLPTKTPTPSRTRTPTTTLLTPKIFGAIRRGQSCGEKSIDYGSPVDFCSWSNFKTQAEVTVYSYATDETFSLGNWDLSNREQCFTGPMSAPYGKNVFEIKSYDGPSYSIEFFVDDCPGDEICESCNITK